MKRILIGLYVFLIIIGSSIAAIAADINGVTTGNSKVSLMNGSQIFSTNATSTGGFNFSGYQSGLYYLYSEKPGYLANGNTIALLGQTGSLNSISLPLLYGDTVQDSKINTQDIAALAYNYGNIATAGLDMDTNGKTDLFDIVGAAKNYGTEFTLPQPSANNLKVSYLDVGQGDAALIMTPAGKNILIDGGEPQHGQTVIDYLNSQNVNTIDVLIISHAHADHIGGLSNILQAGFDVKYVFDTGYSTSTQTYNNLIALINQRDIPIITTAKGTGFYVDPAIKVDILSPSTLFNDPNNNSIVLHLNHGGVDFIFTGDAEEPAEQQMISNGLPDIEILKVGHHGSDTSTSLSFLDALDPETAVISVGEGNSYGHPKASTLTHLNEREITIYRTDLSSSIIVTSNGTSYTVQGTPYIPPPPPQPANLSITRLDPVAEIIEITNNGTNDIDMTGWKIISVVGNQAYNFPPGYILKSGFKVTITSGSGAISSPPDFLKWTGSYIWNNSGDPAELYDPQGNLVSSYPQ